MKEKLMNAPQELHTLILKTAMSGFWLVNMQGRIIEVNESYCKMSGYTESELLDIRITDLEAVDDVQTVRDRIMRIMVSGGEAFESKHRRKDGTVYDVAVRLQYKNINGGLMVGFFNDITQHKKAEDDLRESAWRMESIIEGTKAGTWEWNVQTGEATFNETWAQILGYAREELYPISIKTWESLAHPDDLKASTALLERHFAGELDYYDCECRMKHKDGHWVWVHDRGRVITRTDDGKPLMMFGTHSDITERKETELELHGSKEKYRVLVENLNEGIWQIDKDGNTVFVNEMMAKMLGYERDEMLGRHLFSFMDEAGKKLATHNMERRQQGIREHHDFAFVKKSGEQIIASLETGPIFDDQGNYVGAVAGVQDITERKQLEDKLRESEEMFSMFMKHSPAFVYIKKATPTESVTLRVSDNFQKMTGKPLSDIIGKPVSKVFPADFAAKMTAEDWAVVSSGKSLDQDEDFAGRNYHTTKFPIQVGGQTLLAGYTLDITERKQTEEALRESKALVDAVIENAPFMVFLKEAADLRFIIFNRAGEELLGYERKDLLGKNNLDLFPPEQAAHFMAKDREVLDGKVGVLDIPEEPIQTTKQGTRFLHTKKVCIRGADGSTKYLLGISEDITERKQLEERLRQSEKMEAIGQLAGGIAHDFNNQLAAVLGYAEMIQMNPEHNDIVRFATNISEAGKRSALLIKQLLMFSRKSVAVMVPVDMTSLVREIGDVAERTFDKRITVTTTTDNGATVLGDQAQLHNALLNLAINARDAMPNGGSLTFKTMKSGENLKITVTDTGTGIDAEMQKHIFEPFFTTKEVGKGTGLGLASVYGTVLSHEGTITVDSALGKGTTFTIVLPLKQGTDMIVKESVHVPVRAARPTAIMVVDDDDRVRSLLQTILEGLGYTVMAYADPADALFHFKHRHEEISLSLLDMTMPTMDGASLFAAMKNIQSDLKVLIVSGHSLNGSVQAVIEAGAMGYIEKPFDTVTISEKVADVLKEN